MGIPLIYLYPVLLISLLLLLFGWLSYIGVKRAFDKTPKLILSDKGISTAKTPFYKWIEITISKSGVKTTFDYLIYNCPDGTIQTELTSLATSRSKVDKLFRIYRERSKVQK